MKRTLIIGICLIILCIGFTIKNELTKSSTHYTNIYDITSHGSKLSGVFVSLDATYVAGTITGDNNYSYYVMFGDGVQYIVYMKNKEAVKIQNYLLDNPESSYKIVGITREIPTSLEKNGKKFVREWLDNNHVHDEETTTHSHDITTEEFYEYFGYVYLDSTIYESITNKIIIYLTGIIGIVLVFAYFNKKYRII